jgi:integrator complex subunit 11
MSIRVHTLGAGSEVGRSCFLISIEGVSVLLDAGVHMNPSSDSERIPIIPTGIQISAVIITHYHLDHVGALPHILEVSGVLSRDVEVIMTSPTRTLSPAVCVDYCRGPNSDLYFPNHAIKCFSSHRIRIIGCGETLSLRGCPEFKLTFLPTGHVVGGVCVILEYQGRSVVYTGDFSVNPDSLLNPICIPAHKIPTFGFDVVVSECTHATTSSPSKELESVERLICEAIHRTLARGGKVLVPVFAVGRAQELGSMVRRFLGEAVPMFTTSPASQHASISIGSLHRQWIRSDVAPDHFNMHCLSESDSFPDQSIVFASPAMLEGGSSLRLFSEICEDTKNLVLLTGYCNRGTIGNSVILLASRPNTKERTFSILNQKRVIRCECFYVPFSNHTDSNGIVQVLRQLRPRTGLLLVHGQREKIERFRDRVRIEGVVGPNVEIIIPRNYEIHSFAPYDNTHSSTSTCSRDEPCRLKLRKTLGQGSRLRLKDIEAFAVARKIKVEYLVNNRLLLRDLRSEVIVYSSGDDIVSEFEAHTAAGPEWICCNPIASSLEHMSRQAEYGVGTKKQEFDCISVSECSD